MAMRQANLIDTGAAETGRTLIGGGISSD